MNSNINRKETTNFLGEKNYIVTTADCYKQLDKDIKNGKFEKFMLENHPDLIYEGSENLSLTRKYSRYIDMIQYIQEKGDM